MKLSKMSFERYSSLFFISGLLFGLLLSLSLRGVRYTDFVLPDIVNIKPVDAYNNILNHGKDVVYIDVRSEYEYAQAHASSSVNLPIHYLYDDTHGVKNEKNIPLPKNTNQEIYLICSGGRLAGVAYSYLEHYGYRNIKRVEGGLKGWNEAGLPMVTKGIFDTSSISDNKALLDRPYVPSQKK